MERSYSGWCEEGGTEGVVVSYLLMWTVSPWVRVWGSEK
jgi:hypothetical protein